MTLQQTVKKPKESKAFKIGIVGADKRRMTKNQYLNCKTLVDHILANAKLGNIMEIYDSSKLEFSKDHLITKGGWCIIDGRFTSSPREIVVVSGHCPVGEEKWYCVDCEKWLPSSDGKTTFSICRMRHKVVKVYDKGGIDTLAEIVATELGLKTEIYPAEVHQWNDLIKPIPPIAGHVKQFVTKIGYRSRNIQIAEAIPMPPYGVLYDIEVVGSCKKCKGRGFIEKDTPAFVEEIPCPKCEGTGAYSGGYFTYKETRKLDKEVYQVIIE